MTKEKIAVLDTSEIDELLVLCEEVIRATPDGARRFIEPAPGVLAKAKSKQHNLVFGRRGSGKSSLLRKAAADLTIDRRPIAFIDMETFKGHTYPDVLISVLLKSFHEFEKWLTTAATTPATKSSFWKKLFGTKPIRAPFKKDATDTLLGDLRALIKDLESELHAPESAETTKTTSANKDLTLGGSVGAGGNAGPVSGKIETSAKKSSTTSTKTEQKYISKKVEYLHQHIIRFQHFFSSMAKLSDGSAFLFLDDLYHIRRKDQAQVIDYFHRIAKGNDLWVKVGTIKHRSEWYQHSDPPIGMKLGDDAREINLDVSLEKFETLREFLKKILENLLREKTNYSVKDIPNDTALDRLIIASGGVIRDFIGIFSNSIGVARNRGAQHHRGPKVGAEDVNMASGDYDGNKREEFKLDTDEDRQELEDAFSQLCAFCTTKSKSNIFLISQGLDKEKRDAIDQLIDLRLIHPVKSRVTLKKGAAGELFEAYMLDLSQYVAARKVHDFHMIDLSVGNKDEQMRRSSLIYTPK